ncbi:hypothetical protein EYZ11_006834 [Aspergillus tanneri]|uniref:Uncharacterized protein n=1 Tax=Aspergillus tanneri TaxID=1220188 RepID=A0A4S3JEU3_9EURO|nr:hypothetical protein EYZ11_006834 [Aspergillus tanneri]
MGLSQSKAVIDKVIVASTRASYEGRQDIQEILSDNETTSMDFGSKYRTHSKIESLLFGKAKSHALPVLSITKRIQQLLCLLLTGARAT